MDPYKGPTASPPRLLCTPASFRRNLPCPQSPSSSRLSVSFCLAEKTSFKTRCVSAAFMEFQWKSLAFTLRWFAVMNLYVPEHLAKRGKKQFSFLFNKQKLRCSAGMRYRAQVLLESQGHSLGKDPGAGSSPELCISRDFKVSICAIFPFIPVAFHSRDTRECLSAQASLEASSWF